MGSETRPGELPGLFCARTLRAWVSRFPIPVSQMSPSRSPLSGRECLAKRRLSNQVVRYGLAVGSTGRIGNGIVGFDLEQTAARQSVIQLEWTVIGNLASCRLLPRRRMAIELRWQCFHDRAQQRSKLGHANQHESRQESTDVPSSSSAIPLLALPCSGMQPRRVGPGPKRHKAECCACDGG